MRLTLVLVHDEEKLLLGLKKRGFGAGRWNGFGGKCHSGETVEAAARRELKEEAGIEAEDLALAGDLEFEIPGEETHHVQVYRARSFSGEVSESEEMKPEWFGLQEIPYQQMWAADRHWLPIFLSGQRFAAKFVYDANHQLVNHHIKLLK